jgi:hypothetical protein
MAYLPRATTDGSRRLPDPILTRWFQQGQLQSSLSLRQGRAVVERAIPPDVKHSGFSFNQPPSKQRVPMAVCGILFGTHQDSRASSCFLHDSCKPRTNLLC